MISKHIPILSMILVSLVVLTGCGSRTPLTPIVIRITATPPEIAETSEPAASATAEQPTATSEPAAEATSEPEATATVEPPTVTPVTEMVDFEFVSALNTAEAFDEEVGPEMLQVEGVIRVGGNEIGIEITYDPEIVTEEELRDHLSLMGHPVKE